jgi:hypothetical protein
MQQTLQPIKEIAIMSKTTSSDINTDSKPPLKKAWRVGPNVVVVIDKKLIKRLGIDEENTLFQEELAEGGILLRIIR